MNHSFGPWATSMNAGAGTRLSTFWRSRLARLAEVNRSRSGPAKPEIVGLLLTAMVLGSLPTLHGWAASAETGVSDAVGASGPPLGAGTNSAPSAERSDNTPLETRTYTVNDVLRRIGQDRGLNQEESKAFLAKYLSASSTQVEFDAKRWTVMSMMRTSDRLANSLGSSGSLREEYLKELGRALNDRSYRSEPPRIAWSRQQLAVETTARGHQRIEEALAGIRQYGTAEIKVFVRFVTGPSAEMAKAELNWVLMSSSPSRDNGRESDMALMATLGASSDHGMSPNRAQFVIEKDAPVLYHIQDETRVARVLEQWQRNRQVHVVHAPKTTLFNGQSSFVLDIAQCPFVVSVRVVGPGHMPQIRVVCEGVALQIRPKLDPRGKLTVDFNVISSKIRKLDTVSASSTDASSGPVTVQVPEVATASLKGAIELPLKKWLLLNGLEHQDPKSGADAGTIVMLRFEQVDHTAGLP